MSNDPLPEFDEDGQPSHFYWSTGPWWNRQHHMRVNWNNKDVQRRVKEHFKLLAKIKEKQNDKHL